MEWVELDQVLEALIAWQECAEPSTLKFPLQLEARFCGTGTGFHPRRTLGDRDSGPPLLTFRRYAGRGPLSGISAQILQNLSFALLRAVASALAPITS